MLLCRATHTRRARALQVLALEGVRPVEKPHLEP